MNKSILKRVMSTVLTFALVVTSINWATVTKVNADETTMNITDGQIVAYNYVTGMTTEEVGILSDFNIAGEVHKAVMPTADDNLVTVNSDTGEITAKNYKDQYNNVWKAVLAIITDGENEVGRVSIEDEKGFVEYDGDNYDVSVKYAAETTVANQAAIANIPYYLTTGVENLNILLDDCSAGLSLVEEYLPYMTQLVDGSLGKSIDDGAAKDAINALNKQLTDNGILDLTKLVTDGVEDDNISYDEATSKVEFLITKGNTVKDCTATTYEQLKAISDEKQISEVVELAAVAQPTMANKLNRAMKNIADLVKELEPVYNDEWNALSAKTVKEDANYATLDSLVENAIGKCQEYDFEDAESLVLADTIIDVSVNRYEFTTKIVVNIVEGIDSEETTEANSSVTVTLPAGMTKAELQAYVDEEAYESGVTELFGEDVTAANYEVKRSDLPETLTENYEYVITYSPKILEIDGFITKDVPYGYSFTLPEHSNSAMSYDYVVNGKDYSEGDIVRIVENTTITRTEGKKRTVFTYGELLAADDMYNSSVDTTLSDIEKAILTNDALKTESVALRLPDNDLADQLVIDGQTIIGKDYDAGYEGRSWMPAAYNIYKGDEQVYSGIFNEDREGMFTPTDYDYISVQYMINLGVDSAEVLDVLNIPNTLVKEAKAQKDDLADLLNPKVYDNLGSINKTMLNAMSANLGDASKDAISEILNRSFNNQTGYFYLYEYMTNYKNEGLAYYYSDNNYESIKEQVGILADQLAIISADPELPAVLEDTGYGEFKEKIDDATAILNDAKNGFAAPNEAIDCYSDALDSLVALIENAIETEGAVKEFTNQFGICAYSYIEEPAAGYSVLTIESQKLDSTGKVVASKSTKQIVVTGGAVNGSHVNATLNSLGSSLFEKSSDNYYYTSSDSFVFVDGDLIPVNADMKITRTYEPSVYDIYDSEGEYVGSVSYDSRKIYLAVGDSSIAYEYYINGAKIEVSSNGMYSITDEQLATLRDGTFELTVEQVDVNYNDTLALIEDLNSTLAANPSNQLAFIPVEVDGQLQVVLRLPANDSAKALTDSITDLSQVLLDTKYTYIGIDDNALVNAGLISAQALVDTIVGFDGFGTQTVLDVIDENGNINEMTIDGASIVTASATGVVDPEVYGGEIACATLQLAVSDEAAPYLVPLHITIEDFDAQTANLKNLRAGVEKLVKYVTVECGHDHVDGDVDCQDMVTVEVTAPDDAYAVLLGELLVSGNLELIEINNPQIKTIIDYNKTLVGPVINDEELTSKTIENTLAKLGFEKDLASYDSAFVKFLDGLRYLLKDNSVVVNEELTTDSEYVFTTKAAVDEYLNKLPETMKNLIVDTEVAVNGKLVLTNINKEYEAIIIDNTKEGLDKFTITDDAVTAIAEAGDSSYVMLLGNVYGNVHFNNSAVLNLNGWSIVGNLSSDAAVTVMDTGAVNKGLVTGAVTGDFTITGGYFDADVTAMLPEGYAQRGGLEDAGKVYNKWYDFVVLEDGSYEFIVDASYIMGDNLPKAKDIVKNIAFNLVLNEYTSAKAELDGKPLYDFETINILASNIKDVEAFINEKLDTVDYETIAYLADDILGKLADFTAVSKAAKKNQALASYELAVSDWELTAEIVDGEDYIDVSAKANGLSGKNITLKIGGSEEDINNLIYYCEELKKVVEINAFDLVTTENVDSLEYYVKVNANFDFAVDSNYVVALGMILASQASDKTVFVEGLKDALAENPSYDKLVAEIEKCSIIDITAASTAARNTMAEELAETLGLTDLVVDMPAVQKCKSVLDVIFNWISNLNDTLGSEVLENNATGEYATYNVEKCDSGLYDAVLKFVLCEEPIPPTPTPEPTETPTPEPTETPTATPEAPTETPTATPEAPTATPTATPEAPTATPTATPEAPTATPTATPEAPTEKPFKYGDVDNNGVVEAKDALIILKAVAKLGDLTEDQKKVADVNGDGIVDSTDALIILKRAANLIPELPVEKQMILGDVDFGGFVTSKDALLVLKHAARLITFDAEEFEVGDVDKNDIITSQDALLILKKAAKLIEDFE